MRGWIDKSTKRFVLNGLVQVLNFLNCIGAYLPFGKLIVKLFSVESYNVLYVKAMSNFNITV